MSMIPRSEEDEPGPPRRPDWGSLLALIISVTGRVVLMVLATRVLGSALGGVRVR